MAPKNNITNRDISTFTIVSELWSSETWQRVVRELTNVLEEPADFHLPYTGKMGGAGSSKKLVPYPLPKLQSVTFKLVHYTRQKSHNESNFQRMWNIFRVGIHLI